MISYYLTQTGKALLAGHTKGLTDITFDSIRLGGGQAADPVNSIALADEKLILSNPDAEQNANDDNVVTVSASVSSANIETSFVCSELGLYADGVLLVVAHDDHPVTIPNKTVGNPIMLTYSFNLIMSSTADTAIAIAPSGLVFIKQLNAHKADTAAHVDTLKAVIDDSKTPAADTNEIRELLSNIAAMIKAQTGKADWKDNPATDINTLNSKITGVAVDQTQTPADDTGLDVDTAVSGLANREFSAIGGTDWKDTPEIDLKEAARLMSAISDNNDLIASVYTGTVNNSTVTTFRFNNPYMPVVLYVCNRPSVSEFRISIYGIHDDPIATGALYDLYWGAIYTDITTGPNALISAESSVALTTNMVGTATMIRGTPQIAHTLSHQYYWHGMNLKEPVNPVTPLIYGRVPIEFSGAGGFTYISSTVQGVVNL